MVLCPLEEGWRGPEEPFRLAAAASAPAYAPAKKRACSFRIQYQQAASARRGSCFQVPLEPALVEPGVVEGAEPRASGRAASG